MPGQSNALDVQYDCYIGSHKTCQGKAYAGNSAVKPCACACHKK